MQIPEPYRKQIDPLIAHARGLLEKGETLAALAFVGNLAKNDVIPVVIDDRTEESKDQSAHTIHMTATVRDCLIEQRERVTHRAFGSTGHQCHGF